MTIPRPRAEICDGQGGSANGFGGIVAARCADYPPQSQVRDRSACGNHLHGGERRGEKQDANAMEAETGRDPQMGGAGGQGAGPKAAAQMGMRHEASYASPNLTSEGLKPRGDPESVMLAVVLPQGPDPVACGALRDTRSASRQAKWISCSWIHAGGTMRGEGGDEASYAGG